MALYTLLSRLGRSPKGAATGSSAAAAGAGENLSRLDRRDWHLLLLSFVVIVVLAAGVIVDNFPQIFGLDSGPRAVASQLRTYRLLREQGAPELADMLLDDFQGASPAETPDVVSGVGALLVEEGKGDQAIALLDRALEVLPDDSLLLARGFLLERIDRVPEAVADMRKVAKRRPNDPMTLNALGYLTAAVAMVIPLALAVRFRWFIRLGLMGYAATAIVMWAIQGPYYSTAYIAKAVEVALIVLLAIDFARHDGNPVGVVRRELAAFTGLVARRGTVAAQA